MACPDARLCRPDALVPHMSNELRRDINLARLLARSECRSVAAGDGQTSHLRHVDAGDAFRLLTEKVRALDRHSAQIKVGSLLALRFCLLDHGVHLVDESGDLRLLGKTNLEATTQKDSGSFNVAAALDWYVLRSHVGTVRVVA